MNEKELIKLLQKNKIDPVQIVTFTGKAVEVKVLNDDTARDATIRGAGIQQGSISSMVNYILHTFQINYDQNNPENLAIDVRKAMMKMV